MINILVQLLVGCGLIPFATPYANGPPLSSCAEMFPTGHHVDSQTSESPYEIDLNMNVYKPWEKITVTVRVKRRDTTTKFKGLFVQARRANCNHPKQKEAVGIFEIGQIERYTLQTLKCNKKIHSAVSHKINHNLTNIGFTWMAPGAYIGDIYLVATVVQSQKVFWTGVTSHIIREVNKKDDALGTTCPMQKHIVPNQPSVTTTQEPTVTQKHHSGAGTLIHTRQLGLLCASIIITFSFI